MIPRGHVRGEKERNTVKRRALFAALTAIVGLSAVAVAFGAGPARFHNTFTEEDADFCGTGELVLIQGTEDVTLWTGETGGDPTQIVKANIKRRITYTNPQNGLTVVERWAFSQTNEITSGLESGVHTHEFVERGLKASFKLANGRLLTRDAGKVTYRVTFDADDNFIDFEVVSIRGPHPGFESEEDFFCETLVPALGLD
jgi:hypothetical protein